MLHPSESIHSRSTYRTGQFLFEQSCINWRGFSNRPTVTSSKGWSLPWDQICLKSKWQILSASRTKNLSIAPNFSYLLRSSKLNNFMKTWRTSINLESSMQDFVQEFFLEIIFLDTWEYFPNISLTIRNNYRFISQNEVCHKKPNPFFIFCMDSIFILCLAWFNW